MALGPGKYDDLCTLVREKATARGAIVIVIEGERGDGFSCQATLAITRALPALLREMADQIDGDLKS